MRLSVEQVALCLDLSAGTVERWIRQGRIPIVKKGEFCVFRQNLLEKWARDHHLAFAPPRETPGDAPQAEPATLLAAMQAGSVFHSLRETGAQGLLHSMARMVPLLSASQREELYRRLVEREALSSTGIGKGVAIPHPRVPLADSPSQPLISTFFLENPVNFNALDDKPVSILFLLVSPDVKVHLHLLSHLSFCLRENAFVTFLKTAPAAEALFCKIMELELHLEREQG